MMIKNGNNGDIKMKEYKREEIPILDALYGGLTMPLYYHDKTLTFWQLCWEYWWYMIMFLGFPIISIIEWIHWEIYGKGVRKKKNV
jgi:hypothetical protein